MSDRYNFAEVMIGECYVKFLVTLSDRGRPNVSLHDFCGDIGKYSTHDVIKTQNAINTAFQDLYYLEYGMYPGNEISLAQAQSYLNEVYRSM